MISTLCYNYNIKEGTLIYFPHFIEKNYFEDLKKQIDWEQGKITLYGKTHLIPRLHSFYGDKNISYTYSKITLKAKKWTPLLLQIKSFAEKATNESYNSVLINYYRNGDDYVSWHSDNEKELGNNPTIASVSFGETRKFHIKHKEDKNHPIISIPLESGSVLLMKDGLQKSFVHQIPKSKKIKGPRINLTFRNILP